MATAIDQAADLVASLQDEFTAVEALRQTADKATLKSRAKSIIRKGVDAVSALARARQEMEDQMRQLDAIEKAVTLRINPKIDNIYEDTRDLMNGDKVLFDELYDQYYTSQGYSMEAVPTPTESLDVFNRFSLASVRSTGDVNAILISGILGALLFSRYEVIPHGSAILGFVVCAILMLVLQLLQVSIAHTDTDGSDRTLTRPPAP